MTSIQLRKNDALVMDDIPVREWRFKKGNKIRLGSTPWNKNKPWSEEVKKKISLANKGKKRTEEQKLKMKGKVSWIKGLTKYTDERVRKLSQIMKGKKIIHKSSFKKGHKYYPRENYIFSEETKKRMSESRKGIIPWNKGKKGWIHKGSFETGHKPLSNKYHSIKTNYKEIIFKSKLEADFAKWLDMNNIKWEYEPLAIKWIDKEGRLHYYYPDFLVENKHLLIETKGYFREKDKEKMDYILNHYKNVFKIKIIFENKFRNDKYRSSLLKRLK